MDMPPGNKLLSFTAFLSDRPQGRRIQKECGRSIKKETLCASGGRKGSLAGGDVFLSIL
jgi:hypothetical protein